MQDKKYTVYSIDKEYGVNITLESYGEYLRHLELFIFAYDTDQAYEIISRNYLAYLDSCFFFCSRGQLLSLPNEEFFDNIRIEISRNIMNYLTSARFLEEFLKQKSNNGTTNVSNAARRAYCIIKENKENNGVLRRLSAIRNYTQHEGLPSHSMILGSKALTPDKEGNRRLVRSIEFHFEASRAKNINHYDHEYISSLEDDTIDIDQTLRESVNVYTECLKVVRATISNSNKDNATNYFNEHLKLFGVSEEECKKGLLFYPNDGTQDERTKKGNSLSAHFLKYIYSYSSAPKSSIKYTSKEYFEL